MGLSDVRRHPQLLLLMTKPRSIHVTVAASWTRHTKTIDQNPSNQLVPDLPRYIRGRSGPRDGAAEWLFTTWEQPRETTVCIVSMYECVMELNTMSVYETQKMKLCIIAGCFNNESNSIHWCGILGNNKQKYPLRLELYTMANHKIEMNYENLSRIAYLYNI